MYGEKVSEEVKKEYFETNLKAAELGLPESMSEVAKLYLSGFGIEENLNEAIKWLERAVETGDISANTYLGKIYKREMDFDKVIFYFSQASDENNIEAIKKLADIYFQLGEYEKEFECYYKGAKLGNYYCMREVAACYLSGCGVQQDDLKALEWFIKIIEMFGRNFDNNDMRMVTKIYNKHFKFSDEKFLKYYVTTEKLGHFNAMFGIAAELYKTDKFRALKWYKMAADAGDYDAAIAVSELIKDFSDTSGIEDNYYSACEWYKKAVEFGNIAAAKNLSIMTRDGFGSYYAGYLPDVKKSLYWLKKVLELEAEGEEQKNV